MIRKVLTTLTVALALLLGSNTAIAHAAPITHAATTATTTATTTGSSSSSGGYIGVNGMVAMDTTAGCSNAADTDANMGASNLLPLNRWQSATEVAHSRLSGHWWDDVQNKMQRNQVMTNGMRGGNMFIGFTGDLVQYATHFCLISQFGGAIDSIAGVVGQAFLNSPIPTVGIFLALCGIVAAAARRRRIAWSGIVKRLIALSLVMFMSTQAARSTGGLSADDVGSAGVHATSSYHPATGSPGWFATTIDKTVGAVAMAPTAGIASISTIGFGKNDPDPLSCATYVNQLNFDYINEYGDKLFDPKSPMISGPVVLSELWMDSGLQAFIQAQFGTNPYAQRVYCRLLEMNSGEQIGTAGKDGQPTDPNSILAVQSTADLTGDLGATNPATIGSYVTNGAFAWKTSDGPINQDRRIMGWAACTLKDNKVSNYTNKNGWNIDNSFTTDSDTSPEACWKLFNQKDYDGSDFDVTNNAVSAISHAGPVEANFILNFHGNDTADGTASTLMYVLSALLLAIVFGIIAAAIIFTKIVGLVMLVGVIFVGIAAIFSDWGLNKLGGYAVQYAGMSAFGWFAMMMMAIVSYFSAVMVTIIHSGYLPGGQGGLLAMMAVSFAPVMSVAAIHIIFKRMGLPSPVSLKGGIAWGNSIRNAAAGSVMGGAAVAGGGAALLGSRLASGGLSKAARKKGGQLGKDAVGRVTGGSKMRPAGEGMLRRAGEAAVAGGGAVAGGELVKGMADRHEDEKNRDMARKRIAAREAMTPQQRLEATKAEASAKQRVKELLSGDGADVANEQDRRMLDVDGKWVKQQRKRGLSDMQVAAGLVARQRQRREAGGEGAVAFVNAAQQEDVRKETRRGRAQDAMRSMTQEKKQQIALGLAQTRADFAARPVHTMLRGASHAGAAAKKAIPMVGLGAAALATGGIPLAVAGGAGLAAWKTKNAVGGVREKMLADESAESSSGRVSAADRHQAVLDAWLDDQERGRGQSSDNGQGAAGAGASSSNRNVNDAGQTLDGDMTSTVGNVNHGTVRGNMVTDPSGTNTNHGFVAGSVHTTGEGDATVKGQAPAADRGTSTVVDADRVASDRVANRPDKVDPLGTETTQEIPVVRDDTPAPSQPRNDRQPATPPATGTITGTDAGTDSEGPRRPRTSRPRRTDDTNPDTPTGKGNTNVVDLGARRLNRRNTNPDNHPGK